MGGVGPFYSEQDGAVAVALLNDLFFEVGTSATMRTMAYGVMTITTQPGLSLSAGQPMTVRKDRLHWLYGPVVSYNGLTGELVLDVQHLRGAGTYAGWVLGAAGLPGPAGPSNALQIGTVTTGTHGAPADATITGAPPLQQLNLVLPPGADGDVTPELEALYDDTVTAANVAGAAATAAGNSATAASSSATAAGTAKTAAQAAQGAAETARTGAETAATASAASATQANTANVAAETARTGAEAARTGAESAATAAAVSATAADTAKTAAQAAQGAAEGARDVAQAYAAAAKRVALYFAFDSAVVDADPGAGHWRLNHVAPSSATWLYIDLLASNGGDVTAWIDSWSTSTNAIKGELTLVDAADAGVWLKLQVTGVTVATGYRKVAVTYLGHAGTLLAGHDFSAQFVGYGNKGADGLGTVASVGSAAPIQSTGGNNPVISIDPATPSAPGSLSAADKAKLDGVATGATANAADAALRDRATHTGTQTASTISNFDAQVRTSRLDQMAAPTADVGLNNRKLTGLAAAVASTDAVTLGQLTAAVEGRKQKDPVKWATTANITLSGLGTQAGGEWTGALSAGDRVLARVQTTASANGIYIAAAGAWTRAPDADTGTEITDATVLIEKGATLQGDVYTQSALVATIGTDAQTWVKTGEGNSVYSADGVGVELVGTQFRLKDGGASNAKLADMAANTLKGNAGGATGAPTDIAVGANQFLARSSDGNLVAKSITDVALTLLAQATQALMRTVGLGATTVGDAFFTLVNPGVVSYPRINADNSLSALSPSSLASDLQGDGLTSTRTGFRGIPQVAMSASYTCIASDSGREVLHQNGAGGGHTFSIPSNASVAFDIGTAITFTNLDSNPVLIAIDTDTMYIAGGAGASGTRTLAAYGTAVAVKKAATVWMISGAGLT